MREKNRQIINKLYAIDNVLDLIQGTNFDKFRVLMIKDGEEAGSFELIEESKNQAYIGIIKQLKNRIKELEDEFKSL